VVDLIALAAVVGEHPFLYGLPGTAKSLLIHEPTQAVRFPADSPWFSRVRTRE
jgi:MoxR-like ATPase